MPAGIFAAGIGPAGQDPVLEPSRPRDAQTPVALKWDAATRDFLKDDKGRFLSIHPVDQRVALALTLEEGTLSAAPDMGTRLRRARYAGGAALQREIEDIVNIALKELLDAKDIQLLSVRASTPQRGTIVTDVEYVNLQTRRRKTVRF
jgi:hypothetical protein